ncbi:hypothetical protein HanRHA438_Chr03g0146331 [Helianthus annuus]|nr:hypothetical protein HanRHA438_Chr03g0146331 [Helianthus annuus]
MYSFGMIITNSLDSFAEELRAKRKKQLKKDTASKLKSLVDEGKYEQEYEKSDEFQAQLKLKVREILTDQEWRRRKMQMRISEEEGRLKKDEEESKEMWKRKREHEEQWEGTRENRVCILLFIFVLIKIIVIKASAQVQIKPRAQKIALSAPRAFNNYD